jgi:hypothetical protein
MPVSALEVMVPVLKTPPLKNVPKASMPDSCDVMVPVLPMPAVKVDAPIEMPSLTIELMLPQR